MKGERRENLFFWWKVTFIGGQ